MENWDFMWCVRTFIHSFIHLYNIMFMYMNDNRTEFRCVLFCRCVYGQIELNWFSKTDFLKFCYQRRVERISLWLQTYHLHAWSTKRNAVHILSHVLLQRQHIENFISNIHSMMQILSRMIPLNELAHFI